MKVMLKSHIEREGKTRLVLAESQALQRCAECPHVVNLAAAMQDDDYLFFVLEFCPGGDLMRLIRTRGAQSEAEARQRKTETRAVCSCRA